MMKQSISISTTGMWCLLNTVMEEHILVTSTYDITMPEVFNLFRLFKVKTSLCEWGINIFQRKQNT